MDFFTEAPATDAVWTCSVVRVLVVPKRAYDMLLQVGRGGYLTGWEVDGAGVGGDRQCGPAVWCASWWFPGAPTKCCYRCACVGGRWSRSWCGPAVRTGSVVCVLVVPKRAYDIPLHMSAWAFGCGIM